MLPNPSIPVHGDVERISGLRLKQGPDQDVGRIVDTAGGRPPQARPPAALPSAARPAAAPTSELTAKLGPIYMRAIVAKANAERWAIAAASPDASPMTKMLARVAALEAQRIWREARESTPYFAEAQQ